MTSKLSKRSWEQQKRIESIQMLTELIKRLKNGTYEIEHSGFWYSNDGSQIFFKVSVNNVADFPEMSADS